MILIDPTDLGQIERAAEAAYPAECCGLLVGYGDTKTTLRITRVVSSRNMKENDRQDRFEVDPKVRFNVMRETDGTSERIVGHYHSHPDHPPEPSETDKSMVWEPELVWLITGVKDGIATGTKAHLPTPDGRNFRPQTLEVQTP